MDNELTHPAIPCARDMYCNDELEIDDEPATSEGDDGCWVAAWVWVPRSKYEEPDEETTG